MNKEYCIITDTMTEEMLIEKAINVVVVNRFCELIPLPDLLKWKAKRGIKEICQTSWNWESKK
jgi:hypothetical protein